MGLYDDVRRANEVFGAISLRASFLRLDTPLFDTPLADLWMPPIGKAELGKRATSDRGSEMNRGLLLEQLQRHEGLRLKPYRDTVGKLTIGYGRNLDDRGITDEEAGFMLDNDIDAVVSELERLPLFLNLDPVRQVVLANMAFNMGLPTLLEFRRMLGALGERDWERAAEEMMDSKWARQVGSRADELSELMRLGEAAL